MHNNLVHNHSLSYSEACLMTRTTYWDVERKRTIVITVEHPLITFWVPSPFLTCFHKRLSVCEFILKSVFVYFHWKLIKILSWIYSKTHVPSFWQLNCISKEKGKRNSVVFSTVYNSLIIASEYLDTISSFRNYFYLKELDVRINYHFQYVKF